MAVDPRAEPNRTVGVAEAKAHLSELLEAVAGGEVVAITRRGRPVARLISEQAPHRPIDLDWLTSLTAGMRHSEASAVDIVREMRDARY